MRILVVGAGAVGGYFGGRLAQAGRDVTFLVRPARAAQLRDGLKLASPHGDATMPVKLVGAGDLAGPYDLILLGVKAYALDAAIADFAPAVGPQTTILPALNGMRHIDVLTARFGEKAVLGGVCLVMTEIDSDGRIVQLADIQQLTYGERGGEHGGEATARLAALDAALQGAGFEAHASPDIVRAMWEKWVQLAALGAVTCLSRGAVGQVAATTGGPAFALAMLHECAAVAAACGHAPTPTWLARIGGVLTAAGSPMTSSMFRDLRKGAPVEADHILGDLIARGAAHGVSTPLLSAAYVHLQVYQGVRA